MFLSSSEDYPSSFKADARSQSYTIDDRSDRVLGVVTTVCGECAILGMCRLFKMASYNI